MKYTYPEADNLLIQAYFKDEIRLFNPNFCFCGTLAGNNESWLKLHSIDAPYSYAEYGRMEKALFSVIPNAVWEDNGQLAGDIMLEDIENEDLVFKGMCRARDVLKQIHLDRGEIIYDVNAFKKRELQSHSPSLEASLLLSFR